VDARRKIAMALATLRRAMLEDYYGWMCRFVSYLMQALTSSSRHCRHSKIMKRHEKMVLLQLSITWPINTH